MLEQFLNHLSQNRLCKPADKILVTVSGGLDSMVMLNLFKRAGYEVVVAHCNFQLRGAEADGDEQFVQAKCKALAVPCVTKRFDTAAYASVNKVSVQVAARELRYAWFEEIRQTHPLAYIATAHHVNDSMETVLLKWVHGGSLENFGGIPVKNGNIIRPLLFATRHQLEHYAGEQALTWRDDSSNATDDYQRNFIRHRIIPGLKEINPSLEKTFMDAQRNLSGELKFLTQSVQRWKEQYVRETGNRIVIDKQAISDTPPSVVWRVIRTYGFNVAQCYDLQQALINQPGRKFISETHLLVVDRDQVIVSPLERDEEAVQIHSTDRVVVRGGWEMHVAKLPAATVNANAMIALVDADAVRFPVVWRTWQAGDYFYPLGMEHRKKISDFLTDKKVSLADKATVSVLEANGEIIWVVGHRLDNRFKIKPETKQVLRFSLGPYFT